MVCQFFIKREFSPTLWYYPSNTVVEYLTHHPKINGFESGLWHWEGKNATFQSQRLQN